MNSVGWARCRRCHRFRHVFLTLDGPYRWNIVCLACLAALPGPAQSC